MATRAFQLLLSIAIGLVLTLVACQKDASENEVAVNIAPEAVNSGIIDFMKSQKLSGFESDTIGNAFDFYRHMSKKEWSATPMQSRHIAVDFTGWFDPDSLDAIENENGITGIGIDVTFVIDPDGRFYLFMVSKLEAGADGKIRRSQMQDAAGVLARIYANKKIVF